MIFKSIKILIKKDKLIFFLIIICVIISSLILNFSYGLYQNFNMLKNDEAEKGYEIILSLRDNNIKKIELEQYIYRLEEITDEEIEYWSIDLEKDNIPYYSNVELSNGKFAVSKSFKSGLDKLGMITEGIYFTNEQEANGVMVALAVDTSINTGNQEIIDKFPVKNNKVMVWGKEYDVIGYQNAYPTPIVPFVTIDDDANVTGIIFTYKDRLTRSEYEMLETETMNFWGERIHFPNLHIQSNSELYLYNTVMFISLIISVIAAINFVILYRYILVKRKQHIAVFRICGCTKANAVRIYLSECFTIIIPLYITATLAYNFLLLPLFGDVYENMADAYSIWIYLAIFMIYSIVSLIILLIMMIDEINKSPVTAVKGGNG